MEIMNIDQNPVLKEEAVRLLINPEKTLSLFLKDFFRNKITMMAPENPEGNRNDSMAGAAKRVIPILDQVILERNILELCIQIRLTDNGKLFYPAIHSCVNAVLLALGMGLSDSEIYRIAAACLLQNLGLCEVPFLVNLKKRSSQEEEAWQEHCEAGYYLAIEKGISQEIAELILYHHEQFDGSGFPRHLMGSDIPLGSKIINLCTDFNEMIFIKKWQPDQIVEYFYNSGDGKYDSRVIDAFTTNMPFYPLGSMVRLSTKEIGVVVNVRKNAGLRPILCVCYNRFNQPFTIPKLIDLGEITDICIEEIL